MPGRSSRTAGVLFALGAFGAWGFFPLYFPELFPTAVRATGQGFSFNFGRIVAAVESAAEEIVSMQRLARSVPIAPHVTAYAVSLLAATHPDNARAPELVRRYVRYGGSPRGAQALVLAGKIHALMDGRYNVSTDDVRAVAVPALRHRVIRDFEGEAEGITPEAIVRSVLDAVSPPSVD